MDWIIHRFKFGIIVSVFFQQYKASVRKLYGEIQVKKW